MNNEEENKRGILSTLVRDGAKTAWKKLPFTVKIKIVGGLAVVLLIILFFVVLASGIPMNFLDFSTGINENNYEEHFSEYWYDLCKDGNCSDEQKELNNKLKESQTKFYKKLNQLTTTDRQRELILTTIFYNYDIDRFIEGDAYTLDDDNTINENIDDAIKEYKEDADTIKELVKQFRANVPVCIHDVQNSNGEIETIEEEIKRDDGTSFSFSFFQRFNIEVLNGNGGDEDFGRKKDSCGNYLLNGEKAKVTFKKGYSEDAFFSYLVESSFFDKRDNYLSEFVRYADAYDMDANDLKSWGEEDLKAVRKQIANDIKMIVDEHEPLRPSNYMALLGTNLCENGITVQGVGTISLNEYLLGILSAEWGGLITQDVEAAKAAAVLSRTYVIARSNNCSSTMSNGESNIVFKNINESTYGYQKYVDAINSTEGQVLVDSSGNVKGGHFTTMPVSKYIVEDNGMLTFFMQGIPGNDETNYEYVISKSDMERIAARAGGVYPPQESSGHHWGISQYALTKMAEDGMSYEDILSSTYGSGGIVHIARSLGSASENGLMMNSDYTFLMRSKAVLKSDNNPYYDFSVWNIYECAWYAKYRATEILSTMNWYKTTSWINANGNGGNGGDYCYSQAYSQYTKHYNLYEEGAVKPGMLISWSKSGAYGHVAVIEDVVGDEVTISEAWKNNNWHEGHQYIHTKKLSELSSYSGSQGKYAFACTIDLSTGSD